MTAAATANPTGRVHPTRRLEPVGRTGAPPQVSVVIASYCHAAYVREALESVLAQSFEDFEIVITDDGSPDTTVDAIRSVHDARIHLEALPVNRGACVAMNHSLSRARGSYIAILNSDDIFLPGRLQAQVEFLDTHPHVGAVFGYPEIIDERGAHFADVNHKDYSVFRVGNRDRYAWLRYFFDHGNCLCHPTLMIRRDCYDLVGTYDARLAQVPDLDLWIRLAARFEIHVMPESMVRFRIRDSQMNASAARPEVIRRDAWERSRVLEHYCRMPLGTLHRAFPEMVDSGMSAAGWLATHALALGTPFHTAFALDAMFHDLPADGEGPGHSAFIDLTGRVDPFGLRLTEKPR